MLVQTERRTNWRYVIVGVLAAVAVLLVPKPPAGLASASLLSGKQAATTIEKQQLQGQISQALQTEPETCDPTWRVVPSSNAAGPYLVSLSAASANDVWAVGSYFHHMYFSEPRINHWDGSQWSYVSSPSPGYQSALYGVAAISANDAWAVGNGINAPVLTVTEHWDGSAWSVVPSPNVGTSDNYLSGVAAASSDYVWAVGSYRDNSLNRYRTLVMRWDGSQWGVMPSPNIDSRNNYLRSVSAVSIDDIWAVGSSLEAGSYQTTLTMHWDGIQWNIVDSLNSGSGGNVLYEVSAISANDAWAVGSYHDPSTNIVKALTMHWNGSQWSVVPSPNIDARNNHLESVSAVSTDDVWAVGYSYSGVGSTRTTLTMHWDGSQWTIVPSVDPGLSNYFNAVTVAPGGDVWAVGSATYDLPLPPNPIYPLVERYGDPHRGCTTSFTDVRPENTFYPYVMTMACAGIVSGYQDGTFRPNNEVTRGQLSKIVAGAAGFHEPVSGFGPRFQDVPQTFYEWVERLAKRGFISGYPCGSPGEPCLPGNLPYFRPSANATRGQISKIVANTAGYSEIPTEQTFEDVPPTHTFYREIQRLATRNIMQGYPCGGVGEPCVSGKPYFRPANNVTRGQSAKIVANTFYPGCDTP